MSPPQLPIPYMKLLAPPHIHPKPNAWRHRAFFKNTPPPLFRPLLIPAFDAPRQYHRPTTGVTSSVLFVEYPGLRLGSGLSALDPYAYP